MTEKHPESLDLRLSPGGTFHVVRAPTPGVPMPPAALRRIEEAFAGGSASGIWQLGLRDVETPLPPSLAWLRQLGTQFVTALRTSPSGQDVPPPTEASLDAACQAAPPFTGAEYVTPGLLASLWRDVGGLARTEISASGGDLEDYFRAHGPSWHAVGRVHLHLAENKRDPGSPFAFLATYVPHLSAAGTEQHLPLGHALREYAGAKNRAALLALLEPLQRAAEQSILLRELID